MNMDSCLLRRFGHIGLGMHIVGSCAPWARGHVCGGIVSPFCCLGGAAVAAAGVPPVTSPLAGYASVVVYSRFASTSPDKAMPSAPRQA